jgi:pilus assembly protein Flp/PilA
MLQQSRFFMYMVVKNERGAAAIEYGLIAALVAVALFAGAQLLGNNLNNLFNGVGAFLATVTPPGGGGS